MKKYVILTLVLSAALLIFGLVAVNVPSAHAITTTLPDNGVVGDNFCSDPFFETAPLVGNINSSTLFDSWYFYGSSGSYTYTLSDGLHYSCSEAWRGISYLFSSVPLGVPFTVSFYLKNSGTIYCGLRGHSGSSTVVITEQSIATSSSYRVATLTFTVSSLSYDRYFLFFWLQTASTFDLSAVKFELGSSFTGFVPKDYENYGYDQGNTDGIVAGKNTVYQINKGWSKYDLFRDFKNDDTYLSSITSANGGTVSYVSSRGMKLTSTANGTSFLISTGYQSISSSNDTLTIALGYIGSFTKGDVVLSFDYSYYTGTSSQPPWSGIDPVSTSFSYSLDPGEIFVTTLYPIRDVPAFLTLTVRSGTDFTLQAYKCESGSIFTMFPTGTSDEASFNNGYSSGLTAGIEQGYNNGYSAGSASGYEEGSSVGYAQGLSDGRTEGYSLGLQTAENGTFFALFSALVDVPVSVSISLLDYDFFGINMWNFARFLLTCVLFLAVLHLFTKGKLKA